MTEIGDKKYSLAQVVLLLILVLGLLLAYWTVRAKSDITLTKPVAVIGQGFSTVLPKGAGWNSEETWKFQEQAYYLGAMIGTDPENATSQLMISFSVAVNNEVNNKLLAKAMALGGGIGEEFVVEGKGVTTKIANITIKQNRSIEIFYGIAVLGNGRVVEIELVEGSGASGWGRGLMEKIAASFEYKQPKEMDAAAAVVKEVKKDGAGAWIKKQAKERYCFIGVNGESERGFLAELNSFSSSSQYSASFVNAYFIRDVGGEESALRATDDLSRWVWVSTPMSPQGDKAGQVELYMDGYGKLNLRKGLEAGTCFPSQAAVPDVMLDAVIAKMAQAGSSKIILDLISAEGRIVPTSVEVKAGDKGKAKYVAEIVSLDGTGAKQIIYYDASMKLIESKLNGERTFVIVPATKDAVLAEFALWEKYIQSLGGFLEPVRPTAPTKSRRSLRNGSVI